jgi:hypothetical protein
LPPAAATLAAPGPDRVIIPARHAASSFDGCILIATARARATLVTRERAMLAYGETRNVSVVAC